MQPPRPHGPNGSCPQEERGPRRCAGICTHVCMYLLKRDGVELISIFAVCKFLRAVARTLLSASASVC